MPGFDGTGPGGQGSRTGGGFGWCPPGSEQAPNRGYGPVYGVGRGGIPRGGGRGRAWGGGRGRGGRYATPPAGYPPVYPGQPATYPPPPGQYGPSAADEAGFLEEQAKGMEGELKAIRDRIAELKAQSEK